MTKQELKTAVDAEIERAKQVFVTSHIAPDHDAAASALSMYAYVRQNFPNKPCKVVLAHEQPIREWDHLLGASEISWCQDISEVIEQDDLLILLDGSEPHRFTANNELDLTKHTTICIDHHPDEGQEFNVKFVDTSYAAATAIIYDVFFRGGEVSPEVAKVLLWGIIGDTGTLRYIGPKNSSTLTLVQELVDAGNIEIQSIDMRMGTLKLPALKLLGVLVNNTQQVEVEGAGQLTYSWLDKSVLEDYSVNDVKDAATRYKFSFMRQVGKARWGFVISPSSTQYSISFRSTPGAPNVRNYAKLLGGGGHPPAASAKIPIDEVNDVQELVIKTLEVIKSTDPEII